MFPFEQTHLNNARQFFRQNVAEGAMAVPKVDTFKDYTRYAENCLNMVASTTDQELRCIQREMAAEWLRLLARPMSGKPGPPQWLGVPVSGL